MASGPLPPSLPPSEQLPGAGAGGATHSWSGARGLRGGGPGLAAVQAAGDCARCPGLQMEKYGGSHAVLGGHDLAHLEMAWHTLARFSWGLLGPPQQRNHRGKPVGKVNCKNMKQDCPVPTCPRATLLPGHCCHTCPKGEESGCFSAGSPHQSPRIPCWPGKGGIAHAPEKGWSICYGSHQCP